MNIGVSVSGYTHWRPDWMLRIAKVLDMPVDFNLNESKPSPAEGAGWTIATPAPIVR